MTHTTEAAPAQPYSKHGPLIKLIFVMLGIWVLYRTLFFNVPLFIEETVVKLIFFGLPVWLYVFLTGEPDIFSDLKAKKLMPGIFGGLLFGGLFFLIGSLATVLGFSEAQIADIFFTAKFWREIFLGVMTGFWESLFFFGWIAASLKIAYPDWPRLRQLGLVTAIFVLFHLPAVVLWATSVTPAPMMSSVFGQILLLGIFAVAQGLIYYQTRNLYLLSLTHAFWGLTLQIYG
jgi:hypothetical protein